LCQTGTGEGIVVGVSLCVGWSQEVVSGGERVVVVDANQGFEGLKGQDASRRGLEHNKGYCSVLGDIRLEASGPWNGG
jgi:hypothetical protein